MATWRDGHVPNTPLLAQHHLQLLRCHGPEMDYCWCVYNNITCEVYPLPNRGPPDYELHIAEDCGDRTGYAFVCVDDNDDNNIWPSDFCETIVYTNIRGRLFWRTRDGQEFDLERMQNKWVGLDIQCPEVNAVIKAVFFQYTQNPGHLWIDIKHFFDVLELDLWPHNGSDWFAKRKDKWTVDARVFDLSDYAVRPSVAYAKSATDENGQKLVTETPDARLLFKFPSVHIGSLIVTLARGSAGKNERRGKVGNPIARQKFHNILVSLFGRIPDRTFSFCLDVNAKRVSTDMVSGLRPFHVEYAAGKLNFSDMKRVVSGVSFTLQDWLVSDEGKVCTDILTFEGKSLLTWWIHLCNETSIRVQPLLLSIFKQLIWGVANALEWAIGPDAHRINSLGKCWLRDVSAGHAGIALSSSDRVYSSTNWRHTHRELGRYMEVTHSHMHGCQNRSMAGPDSSTIGTDIHLLMGSWMNQRTKKCAHATPMVASVYLPEAAYSTKVAEVNKHDIQHLSRCFVRAKLGQPRGESTAAPKAKPKMKRVKTYGAILMVNKMMENSDDYGLEVYHITKCPVTNMYFNPFRWPGMELSPDHGPDMTCMDFFFRHKKMNVTCNYDLCHGFQATGRNSLKECGLWPHTLIMATGNNCVYGSKLSPPRLQQVRECIEQHMDEHGIGCEVFLMFLPDLADQLTNTVQYGDEQCAKVVCDIARSHKSLRVKGAKMNLGKYQQHVWLNLKNMGIFSLRGYYFSITCLKYGHQGFMKGPKTKSARQAKAGKPAGGSEAEPEVGLDTALSIKQLGTTREETSTQFANQLERAACTFGNKDYLHKAWVSVTIQHATAEAHSNQAKKLRASEATIGWTLDYIRDGVWELFRKTIQPIGARAMYPRFGMSTSWRPQELSKYDGIIQEQDVYAQLVWNLSFSTVKQAAMRSLEFICGYPRRSVLLCAQELNIAQDFINEFNQDWSLYQELLDVDLDWVRGWKLRSRFETIPVMQLEQCLDMSNNIPTQRLRDFYTEKNTKFISCLSVDVGFGKCKSAVSTFANNKATVEACMATVIDEKVLSSENQFDEIDREECGHFRRFEISQDTWTHPKRKKKMRKEFVEVGFHEVVGPGPADWYSPKADRSMQPECDVLACRSAGTGHLAKLDRVWLCRLAPKFRCLVRLASEVQWRLVVSNVCETLLMTWPVHYSAGYWVPSRDPDCKPSFEIVTDPYEFECMGLSAICPQHKAILDAIPHGEADSTRVKLPDSASLNISPIVAIPVTPVKDMMSLACENGFWDLDCTFLTKLAKHYGVKLLGSALFHVLLSSLLHFLPLPSRGPDNLRKIFMVREIEQEPDCDLDHLCDCEYMLDCFDSQERQALQGALPDAKQSRSTWKQYKQDFNEWKDTNRLKPLPKTSRSKDHPLFGYKFPRSCDFGEGDVDQSVAKTYLPPGSYVWKANTYGGWWVHMRPHKRHVEYWSNHNGSSHAALVSTLQFVWTQFLDDHELDSSHCPIRGIFD